jgi:hypothetical protein
LNFGRGAKQNEKKSNLVFCHTMEAAFEAEADIVKFDIQLTKDGQFVIFHDSVLEYRTNGKGSIREYTICYFRTIIFFT